MKTNNKIWRIYQRLFYNLVEPVFQNHIYLKNNTITLNKSIYNIGLSDSETSLSIGTPNNKSNDTGLYSKFHNSNLVTIPCKKFDDVFFDEKNIDLIKIDVEGMELDVLYSAKKSLIKFKPILYFEINKTIINDYDKISTFLTSLGYEEFANDYFKIDHTLLKYDVIW